MTTSDLLPGRPKLQPYLLIWEDAQSIHHEITRRDIQETTDALITSIGFLVKKDKQHVVLASSIGEPDDDAILYNDVLTVPIGMVRKLHRLK